MVGILTLSASDNCGSLLQAYALQQCLKRDDDLSKAGVTMLGNVDGKSMVERMSPQFLEFVLDAYRSLKYTR